MIQTPEAKQLCTQAEFQLFAMSLSRTVTRHSETELKRQATRSRNLRDKYRSLAQRQRREARGKQQPKGQRAARSNKNTHRKAQLFAEVLQRYEARLAAATARAKKKAAKKTVKKKAASKKSAPSKKTTRKKAAAKSTIPKQKPVKSKKKPVTKPKVQTVAAAKRKKVTKSGLKRKQKHLSAQGKRKQARRDSR